ncbi:MAG: peptidylprolyl isomerase [Proteobacteria bacterium]|nr:peptidylprolyl isomerase [Pseudomonadota bacterium]
MKKTFAAIFLPGLVLAALLFQVLLRGPADDAPAVEKLAAQVNGESLTVSFFNERFERFAKRANLSQSPLSSAPELKTGFLNQLIETRLLLQEARKLGLTVPEEDLDAEMAHLTQDYPNDPFADYPPEDSGLAPEKWREEHREKLLINKVIEQEIDSVIQISDEDISGFYKDNRKEFELPMRVRARQIMVATREEAEGLRKRILKGEDFEELARRHSQSPDAKDGGDLGVFPKGQMPEEFDEVVFRYKVGAVSPVVESPYGFHIFRIEERFPPKTLSLEEAEAGIRAQLFQERREEYFREWFLSLKSQARITTYPENL